MFYFWHSWLFACLGNDRRQRHQIQVASVYYRYIDLIILLSCCSSAVCSFFTDSSARTDISKRDIPRIQHAMAMAYVRRTFWRSAFGKPLLSCTFFIIVNNFFNLALFCHISIRNIQCVKKRRYTLNISSPITIQSSISSNFIFREKSSDTLFLIAHFLTLCANARTG